MMRGAHAVAARLAMTVAIVYAMHFAPNVVRETYLAVALVEHGTVRVDPYVGLHPDIIEIPGRGAYIDSNPGASMIAAIPYAVVLPLLERIYVARPSLVARRLELAAIVMQLGVNVPLGILGVLLMFAFLRDRSGRPREALGFALLYGFGTPIFFRSAFLNQNLLLAHATLLAFLALTWRRGLAADAAPPDEPWRAAAAGALLGVGLLCDYSAAPLLVVFGIWLVIVRGMRGGARASLTAALSYGIGAAGPVALLLGYQQVAFGNALLPAQAYTPVTDLSSVGWYGVRLPMPDLLWRNLLDPAYGLFVFCPMLAAVSLAPWRIRRWPMVRKDELWLIVAASMALYLFSSSVTFARLQGNTGVRYLVPAVPLIFIALAPVLRTLPRRVVWLLVAPTVVISWCVSMARESVPASLASVFLHGPQLPWSTALARTADAYLAGLPRGGLPLVAYLAVGLVLWLLWRRGTRE